MKKIFLTISMLTFASLSPNVSFSNEEDAYIMEANQNALDNYKALYEEQIKTQLDHIYSGFNRIYEIAPNENTLYSRSTEDDILFYATLCSIAYTDQRLDFTAITSEVNSKLASLNRKGYELLGILKRNLKTTPVHSAILLYNKAENHLVLAYKGTVDKDNNDDWTKINLNITKFKGQDPLGALNAPDGTKLNIHGGFARAYLEGIDEFLPQFRELLSTHFNDITTNPKPLRVTTTGHSLGGALSTIAANDMRRILRQTELAKEVSRFIVENVTFASPQVYNYDSARKVERGMGGQHNILRFAHKRDLVPSVPKIYSEHVGTSFYIGESGLPDLTFGVHNMKNYYLALSPTIFRLTREEADYRKYVQDSIVHYKALLGDKTPNHFGAFDDMNILKIDLNQLDASYDFFKGMLKDTHEKEKKAAIEGYMKEIKKERKVIKDKVKVEQSKFKTGFFNYLKNAVGLN
ncbi:MAG: hypothetical protein Q8L85_04380 [Alphaproteobacteria bacterium]|nr:hypothetical protein [Alphaproteobacteria bacterium]MDP3532942.1 hypothetical protein [Alphaproteobacteria bacterium]